MENHVEYWKKSWTLLVHLARAFGQAVLSPHDDHDNEQEREFQQSWCADWSEQDHGWVTRFYLTTNIEAAARTADTMSMCAGTDWAVLWWLFCIVLGINWSSRWILWEPLFRASKTSHNDNYKVNIKININIKDMQNFSQSCTACCFHVASAYFSYQLLLGNSQPTPPWLFQPNEWFVREFSTTPALKFYYLLYAARYASDAASLLWEHGRQDTLAFAVHHIVTIWLVLVSAHQGYIRIGIVIMLFFDWADPFLLAAKACKYLSSSSHDIWQFWSDRLFELFAVVFVVTRNVMFNYIVYLALTIPHHADNDDDNVYVLVALQAMLVVLALLMTYWLVLILKAAAYKRYENNGNIDDIREMGMERMGTPTQESQAKIKEV